MSLQAAPKSIKTEPWGAPRPQRALRGGRDEGVPPPRSPCTIRKNEELLFCPKQYFHCRVSGARIRSVLVRFAPRQVYLNEKSACGCTKKRRVPVAAAGISPTPSRCSHRHFFFKCIFSTNYQKHRHVSSWKSIQARVLLQ